MLPSIYDDDLVQDFTITKYPTHTYRLHFAKEPSVGRFEGTEAMKQAIYLILNCERYDHEMFSWDYGAELNDLIGQQNDSILRLDIEKRVTEALLADDRINDVTDFNFVRDRDKLTVTFTAITTEGDIESRLIWWGDGFEVKT